MTNHEKGSSLTVVGAILLLLTVVIRHTTGDPTALRWADDFLPVIGFVFLAVGIRFNIRARKDTASAPQ